MTNRRLTLKALEEAARQVVRARLAPRVGQSSRVLAQVPADRRELAARFAGAIQASIGIDFTSASPDARLRELLRITLSDLPGVTLDMLPREAKGGYWQAFPYNIMYAIEDFAARRAFREQYETLENPPRNEEEWIELFLDMTVVEFLSFFGATGRSN